MGRRISMRKMFRMVSFIVAIAMLMPFSSDIKLITNEIIAYAQEAKTTTTQAPEGADSQASEETNRRSDA